MTGPSVRATIFGGVALTVRGSEVAVPKGRAGSLLQLLLLRPNETIPVRVISQALWPDESPDDDVARSRIQVVVSRLRRVIPARTNEHSLTLVTDGDGYRLVAGPDSLDRVDFETLAAKALDGRPALASAALEVWRGEPYVGCQFADEAQRQRRRLDDVHRQLLELRDDVAAPALQTTFARTKFLRPRVDAPSIVPRPRLLELAGGPDEVALLFVSAPAGFGKSVFLSQWAQAQPYPVAWLALDPTDEDPARFWSAIHSALAHAPGFAFEGAPPPAAPGSPRAVHWLAEQVASTGTYVGIVLDDTHVVETSEVRRQLDALLPRLPSTLRVAVGTRTRDPLPYLPAELAERSRMITAADLRFTESEAAAVLDHGAADVRHPPTLVAATEGWPIAVAGVGRTRGASEASATLTQALDGYVIDEIVDGLPEDTRSFLMAIAHLDLVTASLGDAVTGDTDAQSHLEWLAERHRFVTEAADRDWYRVHQLVRAALRRRVERDDPGLLRERHRRAAAWFNRHGMSETALEHAFAAGDEETVVRMATQVLADALGRAEVTTAVQWVERLDPDMLAQDRTAHDLAMFIAGAWMTPEAGARWVASRRRYFDPNADLMPLQYEGHQLYLKGRPREALGVIEVARGRLRPYFDADPGWPGARESMRLMADVGALFCRALLGELGPDDAAFERAASDGAETAPGVMDVWIVSHWAWFAWVAGDAARAAELVGRIEPYLDAMEPMAAHLGAQMLLVMRAVLASEQAQDPEEQRRIVADLMPVVELHERLRRDVEVIPMRLVMQAACRRSGDLADARRHLARADALLARCDDVPLLAKARARLILDAVDASLVPGTAEAPPLTPRERSVLAHLDQGMTYAEVAQVLGIRLDTVRSHARAIYRKLDVRSRHGAARQSAGRVDRSPTFRGDRGAGQPPEPAG